MLITNVASYMYIHIAIQLCYSLYMVATSETCHVGQLPSGLQQHYKQLSSPHHNTLTSHIYILVQDVTI